MPPNETHTETNRRGWPSAAKAVFKGRLCGTAEAVPFPIVSSPNSGSSMRQGVGTRRGAHFQYAAVCGDAQRRAFPGRAFPESRIDCKDYAARLKPCPSRSCLPRIPIEYAAAWGGAEAGISRDMLHFSQNLSRNEKPAYYFWREGHDFKSCRKEERDFPALAAEVVPRHNIEPRGLKPGHCCAFCGTAKAVPFPVVPSPNCVSSMRQYVGTRRGGPFPVVLSPEFHIDCEDFVARLKPCPSRSCLPRIPYRLRRLVARAEAAPFPGSLASARTFPETRNSLTISGGKGTTLSRAAKKSETFRL